MRIRAFTVSIGINTLFLVLTLLHGDVRLDTVRPVPRKNKPRRGASHTCVPTRSVGTRARMPVSISQSECVDTLGAWERERLCQVLPPTEGTTGERGGVNLCQVVPVVAAWHNLAVVLHELRGGVAAGVGMWRHVDRSAGVGATHIVG